VCVSVEVKLGAVAARLLPKVFRGLYDVRPRVQAAMALVWRALAPASGGQEKETAASGARAIATAAGTGPRAAALQEEMVSHNPLCLYWHRGWARCEHVSVCGARVCMCLCVYAFVCTCLYVHAFLAYAC
jgi:hypothetical protein